MITASGLKECYKLLAEFIVESVQKKLPSRCIILDAWAGNFPEDSATDAGYVQGMPCVYRGTLDKKVDIFIICLVTTAARSILSSCSAFGLHHRCESG